MPVLTSHFRAATRRPGSRESRSLVEVLASRRSVREFSPRELTREEILELCWAAQGVTSGEGFRTVPSAGAMYPLQVFVANSEGIFEYLPEAHELRLRLSEDRRPALQAAAQDQPCVGAATCCFIIAGDAASMEQKYGPRSERYCMLEAGHVAQNILLMATDLGLGGVPVGAFSDHAVTALLNLPPELEPLYLLPVGHPMPASSN